MVMVMVMIVVIWLELGEGLDVGADWGREHQ